MARIRSIKPGYFTSLDTAGQLTRDARLHFAGLWTYADDAGRGVDEARLLKAALWPLDDDIGNEAIESMQDELERAERIIRYSVDGRRYFAVVGWGDHQRPNKPQPSSYPPPEEDDGSAPPPSREDARSDTGAVWEPYFPEGRGKEGSGEESSGGDAVASPNGHDSRTFTERCEAWIDEQGVRLPPADQELDRRKAILECVLDSAEDKQRARQASMGIVADYMEFLTGKKPRGEARDMVWALVGEFGGMEGLRSAYESCRHGAGLAAEYRDDPLAVAKYMSAVLHGHGSKEAS